MRDEEKKKINVICHLIRDNHRWYFAKSSLEACTTHMYIYRVLFGKWHHTAS